MQPYFLCFSNYLKINNLPILFSDTMQRIMSIAKTVSCMVRYLPGGSVKPTFSLVQNLLLRDTFLTASTPIVNPVCHFKVKGRLKRRCKSCYFVVRDERLYVICPKFPRHKQMAMKPKPHNTWILTHASQSPVRPW